MTEKEHLLVILAEECAEIQQAATKSLRFGLDNHHPSAPMVTNERALLTEYHHLVAVMEMLCERGVIQPLDEEKAKAIRSEKKQAVCKYMDLSCTLGRVAEDAAAQSNEPLTYDELMGMNGEPVWVECADERGGSWGVIYGVAIYIPGSYCEIRRERFGEGWKAYRRKPEDERK